MNLKRLLAYFLSTALILSIASATTAAQNSGSPFFDIPYSADTMRSNLEKCVDYLNAFDIRVNNLRVLLNAYSATTMSAAEQARYDGWKNELEAYEKADDFGITKRNKLCMAVEIAQKGLLPPNSPTPTQTPVTTAGSSSQSSEPPITDEDIKQVKMSIERFGPLENAVNEFVRTRKASLPAAAPIPGTKTEIQWQPGLQVIRVDTPAETITISLPDDIRAGDTISGTVYVEPKSKESGKNETRDTEAPRIELMTTRSNGSTRYIALPTLQYNVPLKFADTPALPIMGYDASSAPSSFKCSLLIVDGNGKEILITPVETTAPAPGAPTGTADLKLPTLGQANRPLSITGPFDGDASSTKVTIGSKPIDVIAETPRECIVRSPADLVGTTEINVDERGKTAHGPYRNLALGLSAPNTNLRRGERTTLTVQVTGLSGIRNEVPLQLIKTGTVTMDGGDTQHLRIRPQDVRADGTYTLTRGITGVQAGGFGVTATVFDAMRRSVVIPLTRGAKVNGYEITMDNGKPRLSLDGVIDPLTGKPLAGSHRLRAGCQQPSLMNIPYMTFLFKSGRASQEKNECMILINPRIIIQE